MAQNAGRIAQPCRRGRSLRTLCGDSDPCAVFELNHLEPAFFRTPVRRPRPVRRPASLRYTWYVFASVGSVWSRSCNTFIFPGGIWIVTSFAYRQKKNLDDLDHDLIMIRGVKRSSTTKAAHTKRINFFGTLCNICSAGFRVKNAW